MSSAEMSSEVSYYCTVTRLLFLNRDNHDSATDHMARFHGAPVGTFRCRGCGERTKQDMGCQRCGKCPTCCSCGGP